MLSQQFSISSLSWVITRMVLPCRASLFSLSAIRRMFRPSRPLVGSSRISILRPEKTIMREKEEEALGRLGLTRDNTYVE